MWSNSRCSGNGTLQSLSFLVITVLRCVVPYTQAACTRLCLIACMLLNASLSSYHILPHTHVHLRDPPLKQLPTTPTLLLQIQMKVECKQTRCTLKGDECTEIRVYYKGLLEDEMPVL